MDKDKRQKVKHSLLLKILSIFALFTFLAVSFSGLNTYITQMRLYKNQCLENLCNIVDYLQSLIMDSGQEFADYQKYFMEHYTEIDIPYDFDEYLTAQNAFLSLLSQSEKDIYTAGSKIDFDSLSEEAKKAYFIYCHEYWTLTFENARKSFNLPYTYYLVPKENDFLMYYMICGIGAGLIQEMGQMAGLISPYSMTIGASGAVYGILLAFGMTFPNERLFIIPIPFPIKAKWFICIYVAIEILEGMSASDGVAHFAHLGGMFFGLVLILFWRNAARCRNINFGKNFWRKPDSQPSMHVSYNDNYTKDYEYNSRKKARNDEIDRILDKVRQGGYESLTESEKQTLFDASGR